MRDPKRILGDVQKPSEIARARKSEEQWAECIQAQRKQEPPVEHRDFCEINPLQRALAQVRL